MVPPRFPSTPGRPLQPTARSIFVFWAPLAATWLMMAVEGPFLAAVVARLPEPTYNLAAFGVSVAFAILVEAPVIMIMSASTALAEDRESYRKLRNFTYGLNGAVTGVMLLVLLPPVFDALMQGLIGLTDEVARLTHGALVILLPWPGAIGYRRFYQGLLIRGGRTRLVAYGTVLRVGSMTATAIVLYAVGGLPGAFVGAAALSAGVCLEAAAVGIMARGAVKRVRATPQGGDRDLRYREIAAFYYPLALTSLIGLVVQPMLTFFMGRAPHPVESLAVFPVVHSLTFVFRALGLSYQEVAIALLGRRNEHIRPLTRFAVVLGLAAAGGLAAIAFTPLARVWFVTISGLEPELAAFAIAPTRILVPLPFLSVLLSLQRAVLVNRRATRSITMGTAVEVGGVAVLFVALADAFALPGVTAAALAFLGGRLLDNLYLAWGERRTGRSVKDGGGW